MNRVIRFLPAILALLAIAIAVWGAPFAATQSGAAVKPRPWVFHGYKDGPVGVSPTTLGEIARLNLPAGKYTVTAKVWLQNTTSADRGSWCRLVSANSMDESAAQILKGDVTIPLSLSDTLTTASSVRLLCASFGGGGLTANWVKITALKVGTIEAVQMK